MLKQAAFSTRLPAPGREAQEMAIAAIDHALSVGRQTYDLGLERAGFQDPALTRHAEMNRGYLPTAGPASFMGTARMVAKAIWPASSAVSVSQTCMPTVTAIKMGGAYTASANRPWTKKLAERYMSELLARGAPLPPPRRA